MKKLNIIYWTITLPFAAFMLSSAIPNMMATPEWVGVFKGLGYPEYIIPFIGFAKLAGIVGILIPGFPRVTEWAYAGLAFDLIGATYSILALGPTDPAWTFMLVLLLFLALSYVYYHKRLKLRTATRQGQHVFGTHVPVGQ